MDTDSTVRKRFKLIACEVMYREFCHVVASSPHTVDVEFVAKGLHDLGAEPMLRELQTIVDRVPADRYEAVLLGYALCNNGLVGLTARHTPLVLPRAHDCITLFMGSKERYRDYFYANPGVYFKTSGWIERGEDAGDLAQLTIQRKTGMDSTYQELVDKYGEDNAAYLYSMLCETTRNYTQFTYIEMGIEPDNRFEEQTRRQATERGWKVEKIQGDMGMFRRLVDGQWDDEAFLVIEPGQMVVASNDDGIVKKERASA